MTDKITLELTLDELKLIDKYVELNDETQSVFDKIKDAYPQPQMNLRQEGEYAVVSFNDKVYYRLESEVTFLWYIKKGVSANHRVPTLVMVEDAETERLLEGLYYNHIQVKKEKVAQEPEEDEWKSVALRFGEKLSGYLSDGYYELSPAAWFRWAVFTYGKGQQIKNAVRESVKWCEEHPDWDLFDCLKPQTPNDKNFKNYLDLIKEWGEKNKSPTLKELLWEWWEDIFTVDADLDADASIDVLVDIIDKKFIPPSNDRNGYEWEKCLKIMREKLR